MEIKLNDVEAFVDADELADEVVETQAFDSAVRGVVEDMGFVTEGDLPETPDLDDYVTRIGLAETMEEEAEAMLRSMPDDPARRCRLGQAFTRAVEQVVLNSDSLQALIEVFVTDALDAKAQAALDVEWAAITAALPVSGVAVEQGTPSVEGDSTDEGTPGRFHTVAS